MRLADLRGRSVAVWGAGREGRAAVRAIAPQRPSRLLAVDDSAAFLAIRWEAELASLAPLAGGDHAFPALVTADVVVLATGVPPGHAWLQEIRERGIAVTSCSALWLADHGVRTIAVTGGEDRSATAALLSHLLTAVGRPGVLGGGAGVPLLELPEAEQYVVELSGEQCADLTSSPRVAVVTGYPDDRAAAEPAGADRAGSDRAGSDRAEADRAEADRAEAEPAGGEPARGMLNLLRHDPEMIVVNGLDRRLRDEIRGISDVNRFPPIPAAAADSRFRVEAETVFCSDDPLFPGPARRSAVDRHSLCVALAVLDGLGVDVIAGKAELAAAVASFAGRLAEIPDSAEPA